MRWIKIGAMCALAAGGSGCTTFTTTPRSFITRADTAALRQQINFVTALRAFAAADDADRQGLTRQDYRDFVVGAYLGAIDVNYYDFRAALSADERGSALTMDMLLLGLTSAAAVAGKNALDEITAGIAFAAGTRVAIDKNLFFDRTLPAVLAATEAERAKRRTVIEGKLKLSAAAYPLLTALYDLKLYEQAGTPERGIDKVNAVIAEVSAVEQARLDNALLACAETTAATAGINYQLRTMLGRGVPGVTDAERARRLALAAPILGADVVTGGASLIADNDRTWTNIVNVLETKFCADAARSAKLDEIKAVL